MYQAVTFLFLCFLLSVPAFSQSLKKEIEKAKEIKLLESTSKDVRKILADFEYDKNDKDVSFFSTKNAEINVTFSLNGNCEDLRSAWKVARGIATKITIEPTKELKVKDFDFTNFKKETEDKEYPEDYFYHNENEGISFEIKSGEITKITLYPPKSKIGFLCEYELTKGILSGEESYSKVIDSEYVCILINHPANVTELNLSTTEANISCSEKDKNCVERNLKITVNATAIDPENDTLVYSYTASAGKIVGAGAKVFWDLSGVKAGTYTITAAVDDGCGYCGKFVTKTVIVKEFSDPDKR